MIRKTSGDSIGPRRGTGRGVAWSRSHRFILRRPRCRCLAHLGRTIAFSGAAARFLYRRLFVRFIRRCLGRELALAARDCQRRLEAAAVGLFAGGARGAGWAVDRGSADSR